ncbi:MAG: hypothetical protein ABI905_02375 [Betaproteobacteria bacterium]
MKMANNPVHAGACIAALMMFTASAHGTAAQPGWQQVDLRSFFHGEPPPPPKAPPPKQLATISMAPGVAVDAQVDRFLRGLADAIKAREGKPMLALLSPKYAIDDLPPDRKPADMFVQAMEQIAGPSEMQVMSLEKQGVNCIAKVEFRFGTEREKSKTKTFEFDGDGKLLRSDLFKLQIQQVGA